MPQSRFGQIIAQGKTGQRVWQDLLMVGTNDEILHVWGIEGASLGDLMRVEYLWCSGGGIWQAVERINKGIQKSTAPKPNICRWCYESFDAAKQIPVCEKPECAAACENCLIPSRLDPDVKACPDHIRGLNAQMALDLRAA